MLTSDEKSKLAALRMKKALRDEVSYRTLVHIENGHNKYWKIGRNHFSVHTEFGDIDGAGTRRSRVFTTIMDAITYINTKWIEKLDSGYEELK